MEEGKVNQIIEKCINRLYREDKYLFECQVCERCLMFRLVYYLQLEFPNYFVDCEFNKMGFIGRKNQNKVEPSVDGNRLKRMFADIIVHKRNSNTADNFICLEIKRTQRKINNDVLRLKRMTYQNGFEHNGINYLYGYDIGFLVYLPKDKNRLKLRTFSNGKENTQN